MIQKTISYKLLDTYQTNAKHSAPITSGYYVEEYGQDLENFAKALQKYFAFNKVENSEVGRAEIREVFYNTCAFSNENICIFSKFVKNLIGNHNFAYGLKLYTLFEEELSLKADRKHLFESRLRDNTAARIGIGRAQISKDLIALDNAMAPKLSRYKIFEKNRTK